MPKHCLGISRRELLRTGALSAGATVLPGAPAAAAIRAPAPAGDDVGYLVFGASAEGVLARLFTNALALGGAWTALERRRLREAHSVHRRNVDRINAALPDEDRITLDLFARTVPVRSRHAAVATGRRLETLAAGTYLSGITNTTDPGSRQLLGRLLSAASRNEALLTGWSGGALGGLTAPISLDTAGAALDRYLEDPS